MMAVPEPVAIVAPVGLESTIEKVSAGSATGMPITGGSGRMGTVIVAVAAPAAKVTVPETDVKS